MKRSRKKAAPDEMLDIAKADLEDFASASGIVPGYSMIVYVMKSYGIPAEASEIRRIQGQLEAEFLGEQ